MVQQDLMLKLKVSVMCLDSVSTHAYLDPEEHAALRQGPLAQSGQVFRGRRVHRIPPRPEEGVTVNQ